MAHNNHTVQPGYQPRLGRFYIMVHSPMLKLQLVINTRNISLFSQDPILLTKKLPSLDSNMMARFLQVCSFSPRAILYFTAIRRSEHGNFFFFSSQSVISSLPSIVPCPLYLSRKIFHCLDDSGSIDAKHGEELCTFAAPCDGSHGQLAHDDVLLLRKN